MIKNIIIDDFPPFKKGTTVELTTVNLFVGKNGSGKSRFLKQLHQFVENNTKHPVIFTITRQPDSRHFSHYIAEERFSEVRDQNLEIPSDINLEKRTARTIFSNYTMADELVEKFNYEFLPLIRRKLIIAKKKGKGH